MAVTWTNRRSNLATLQAKLVRPREKGWLRRSKLIYSCFHGFVARCFVLKEVFLLHHIHYSAISPFKHFYIYYCIITFKNIDFLVLQVECCIFLRFGFIAWGSHPQLYMSEFDAIKVSAMSIKFF